MMVISGLTLAVLLFLLLVYLPGNVMLITAGRKQQDRTVPVSIFYGTLFLTAVLSIFGILALINKSDILPRFVATLMAITEGSLVKGSIDLVSVTVVFAVSYALACIAGFLELSSLTGFYTPLKCIKTIKFMFVLAYKGFTEFRITGVQVKPANTILDIFVRFRKAGKRPHLEITLKNGTVVTGECLRFSWNGKESVLLADMDNPGQLNWVTLDDAVSIKFLNLAFLDEEEKHLKRLEEIEKSRQILNGLIPGYGDEVYGKEK